MNDYYDKLISLLLWIEDIYFSYIYQYILSIKEVSGIGIGNQIKQKLEKENKMDNDIKEIIEKVVMEIPALEMHVVEDLNKIENPKHGHLYVLLEDDRYVSYIWEDSNKMYVPIGEIEYNPEEFLDE